MKDLFLKYWVWVALFMSLYWGIRAYVIFTPKGKKFRGFFLNGVYQFIFNFVGSLAGWCCLYVFIKHASFTDLGLADFVLLIFGIMGLTGHLPQFILGIITLPTAVANYISKKLKIE